MPGSPRAAPAEPEETRLRACGQYLRIRGYLSEWVWTPHRDRWLRAALARHRATCIICNPPYRRRGHARADLGAPA